MPEHEVDYVELGRTTSQDRAIVGGGSEGKGRLFTVEKDHP